MILTFSEDKFINRILLGVKWHTIRKDSKKRWKAGMKIHYWRGNPRNVNNNPYQFAEGTASSVYPIIMDFINDEVVIDNFRRWNNLSALNFFAIRDGFDSWKEMKEWFNTPFFEGRIIYWEQPVKPLIHK